MAVLARSSGRSELWWLLFAFLVGVASCGSDAAPPDGGVAQASTTSTATETIAQGVPSSSVPNAVDETSVPATTTGAPTTTGTSTTTVPTSTTVSTTTTSVVPISTETTSVDNGMSPQDAVQVVRLRFESEVADVPVGELRLTALEILNDARGWPRAGFSFESDDTSLFRVVLAEGRSVDRLCAPLSTGGTVSCQNGPVVALNADRWRRAVAHWDAEVVDYRGYLVNHEVGHLLGQRHPVPRCPAPGRPAAVMEQQTGGLAGCVGNAWPRDWEIDLASQRPVVYAPLPDWGPDPRPANTER